MNTEHATESGAERPKALSVIADNIPAELKQIDQWVVWKYEFLKGRWTKPPYQVSVCAHASSTNPKTWGTFRDALKVYKRGDADGIGFVVTEEDDFVGIDLDHCAKPVKQDAMNIIAAMQSYTEISPSGEGFRIFVKGRLPDGIDDSKRKRKGNIEVYASDRYFTITGRKLETAPSTIETRQGEIEWLFKEHLADKPKPKQKPANGPNGHWNPSDDELIAKAFAAKNGLKIKQLFNGDIAGYPSQSEADFALCSFLAFWAQDSAQLDGLFRRSGLMRDKWDEKHGAATYGEQTIGKAWEGRSEHYEGARQQCGEAAESKKELPTLDAGNHNLKSITDATLKVLIDANDPPFLFRHAESIARVQSADDGSVAIRMMSEDALRHVLARVAYWYTKKKKRVAADLPPRHVAKDILAMPSPPFPVITRIVHAPIFAADGSLVTHPGYNEAGKVYLDPAPRFRVPPVSPEPSQEEISMAADQLEELLCDFPFVGDAEKAHTLALLLLPFARELIDSPTPLHLIEKPSPGTGASLLADVVLYPALGRRIAILAEGRDDDEWRKRITAKLVGGASVLLIDNLRRHLESSSLSAAITSLTWEDRILGHTQMAKIPVRCAWLATGNNPALSNEIARRTIRIRLDAHTDRPWLRAGFTHGDLRSWVCEQRAELVHAALTLIQAWIATGRPEFDGVTFGMFESWSRVMGGILEVAGVRGFLTNLEEFYEASDSEGQAWRSFVAQWWETHHDEEVGVTDLFKIVAPEGGDPIDIYLGKGNERSQKTRLGIALNQARDRQFDNKRIVKRGMIQGSQMWSLGEV